MAFSVSDLLLQILRSLCGWSAFFRRARKAAAPTTGSDSAPSLPMLLLLLLLPLDDGQVLNCLILACCRPMRESWPPAPGGVIADRMQLQDAACCKRGLNLRLIIYVYQCFDVLGDICGI